MVYNFFKNLTSEATLRGISSVLHKQRLFCTAAQASQILATNEKHITSFRTAESNPLKHNFDHAYRFYTIPVEVKNQLFQHGGLPKYFNEQAKAFMETCVMVRDPALEILHYLKTADYSRPAIRYVIYGESGCGKSITLAHILHYGLTAGFLLIHVPWVPNWMRVCKEVSNSATREGYVDLNLDAAEWLIHFKNQNAALLNNIDLRVSKEYAWSKREKTEEGVPLLELVEHGINRVKYASECVVALVKEIKLHSTQGRCKTLVVIDGFNAFFHPRTRVVTAEKIQVPPSKITLTEAFIEITKYDWCNGAVILTVDKTGVADDRRESFLPIYQLGKEGFEHLDPFVPISVREYSEKELESCLDYYVDRRWLQNEKSFTEEGRKELKYLCGMNPRRLMHVCAPL
ncbi:28S ribosomal protein S29, mitochondrial [Zootermopsis nevadensis]|uniref:Small ribosomal subunit protein mS29 n=1 Tax=Zootermopsis nevadensis TaxID=136037 RepID=A0A067RA02_ZOONE|nr:28S ribosomal protein S29, mitochondrial [Zootermopsis nevadensis]KDR19525.1 28S ribosomal protein S29, mitochondrial [Zootermopsis nevadensis]